jgi:hypothetical protein
MHHRPSSSERRQTSFRYTSSTCTAGRLLLSMQAGPTSKDAQTSAQCRKSSPFNGSYGTEKTSFYSNCSFQNDGGALSLKALNGPETSERQLSAFLDFIFQLRCEIRATTPPCKLSDPLNDRVASRFPSDGLDGISDSAVLSGGINVSAPRTKNSYLILHSNPFRSILHSIRVQTLSSDRSSYPLAL